ncbi:MAG: hypothetical protein ACJ76Z_10090 [Thermoleophilaceae bacterium]
MRKLLAATAMAAICVGAGAQAAGNGVTDAKNQFPKSSDTATCNGDTITFYGSKKLWPPNHKYRTVTITATESHPTPYSFTTMTTSNEGELDPGSGHTVLDAAPPASSSPTMLGPGSQSQDILLRAERDGGGSGRTYSIAVDARFDGGANDCQHTFTVTVPHDMRGGASR